jgi:hypothetical protein
VAPCASPTSGSSDDVRKWLLCETASSSHRCPRPERAVASSRPPQRRPLDITLSNCPGRHEQDQEAGDNSEQQQAARDIINITQVGVSAADVIAITRSETKRIIEEELTPAAERIAHERLDQFEQKMIDRFAEDPQLRKAFADPDFQYSLRDASRATASNDDDHTEDLLVDLLSNRAMEGNRARLRLITSRAIQAADKLSIEALRGLTATWAVTTLGPSEPSALGYITACTGIATIVLGLGTETDHGWIEDLEALGLARTASGIAMSRKPYKHLLEERAAAHLNQGSIRRPIETSSSLPSPNTPGLSRCSYPIS